MQVHNFPTFSLNSAKSYVGKTVNLHLKDGSNLLYVKVLWARRTSQSKHIGDPAVLCCSSKRGREIIPLRQVAYAESVGVAAFTVTEN